MHGKLLLKLPSSTKQSEVDIDTLPLSIGRTPQNGVIIDHPSISRQHAEIIEQGSILIIKDKNSANGIYLNERRVSEIKLDHDVRFYIGQVQVQFLPMVSEDKTVVARPSFADKTTIMNKDDDLLSARTVIRTKTSSIKLPEKPKKNSRTSGKKAIPLPPLAGQKKLSHFRNQEGTSSTSIQIDKKGKSQKKKSFSLPQFKIPEIDFSFMKEHLSKIAISAAIIASVSAIGYAIYNYEGEEAEDTSYSWYKKPPRTLKSPTAQTHPVQNVINDIEELSLAR